MESVTGISLCQFSQTFPATRIHLQCVTLLQEIRARFPLSFVYVLINSQEMFLLMCLVCR